MGNKQVAVIWLAESYDYVPARAELQPALHVLALAREFPVGLSHLSACIHNFTTSG